MAPSRSSTRQEQSDAHGASTIEVAVAGRGIKVSEGYERPSAGDVNTCSVSIAIEGGGVWDTLPKKRVTFSTSTASVTVDYAPTILIPHEVMASAGTLYLTLTGYNADGIEVARTHRMTCPIKVARAGADEGASPTPATLDVVSRIDALAADLEEKRDTDYWRGEQGPKGDPGEPGSDATATDVRINGKSITADGVADIPLGSNGNPGVVGINSLFGLAQGTTKNIYVVEPSIKEINARSNPYRPITSSTLDYAVKAAMCDGKGAAWTAEEQAAARKRMGFGDRLELIEVWELDHDETMAFSRNTTPAGDPYRFKELRVAIRHANGSGAPNISIAAHSAKGNSKSITMCYLPAPKGGDKWAAINASAGFGTINTLCATNVDSMTLKRR